MHETEADRRANARLAPEPWFQARAAGKPQSNPRHFSNCQDCYTLPADHLENGPAWTEDELGAFHLG